METTTRSTWSTILALLASVIAVLALGVGFATGTAGAAADGATNAVDHGLSKSDAAILGVVEGITEYLPISSTGHLMVTNRILDVGQTDETKDAADSYVVIIQAGAILAVLVLYRKRVGTIFAGLAGRDVVGRRLLRALIVSMVPAVVIALGLESTIKDKLFHPWPVVAAWIVGGVAILVWARMRGDGPGGLPLESITMRIALIVGLAQVLALWPGTSRSLVTIVAALFAGMSLPAAVEYSFLLGLTTLGAATGYEALKNGSTVIDTFGWTPVVLGIVVAFVAAMVAVRWMVTYLQRHSFSVFGWYRIAAGLLAAVLLATHAI
jgi:undecaprenyl-diphosphatase